MLSSHPFNVATSADGIDLALFPVGFLSGRIATPTDRQIVTVWARSTTRPDARSHHVRTDARGTFRFATLPAGDYEIGFWRLPFNAPRLPKKIVGGFTVRAGVETIVTLP